MYRKLHNSLLAFSATGMMLILGLMAARPLMVERPASGATPRQIAAIVVNEAGTRAEAAADVTTRSAAVRTHIAARTRRLEAELDQAGSLGDTIASAVSYAAEVSTDAALNATFDGADEPMPPSDAQREQRQHAQRVRSTLALPYFSFAQGLRRNGRS